MNTQEQEYDDLIQFADEESLLPLSETVLPWRILVVDDDGEVHQATRYALENVRLLDRPINLIHAYSAAEAEVLLRQNADIAVVLLDVVMESDDSGLCLIDLIRDQLQYSCLRIILRTGQPGSAPEASLVARYDIHDYMLKTDVSRERLMTSLTTAVRTYQQLTNMELMEKQLVSVVQAVDRSLIVRDVPTFIQFYWQQLKHIYQLSPLLGVMCHCFEPENAHVVIADEAHQHLVGLRVDELPESLLTVDDLRTLLGEMQHTYDDVVILQAPQQRLITVLQDEHYQKQVLKESWHVFHALMNICFKRVFN